MAVQAPSQHEESRIILTEDDVADSSFWTTGRSCQRKETYTTVRVGHRNEAFRVVDAITTSIYANKQGVILCAASCTLLDRIVLAAVEHTSPSAILIECNGDREISPTWNRLTDRLDVQWIIGVDGK